MTATALAAFHIARPRYFEAVEIDHHDGPRPGRALAREQFNARAPPCRTRRRQQVITASLSLKAAHSSLSLSSQLRPLCFTRKNWLIRISRVGRRQRGQLRRRGVVGVREQARADRACETSVRRRPRAAGGLREPAAAAATLPRSRPRSAGSGGSRGSTERRSSASTASMLISKRGQGSTGGIRSGGRARSVPRGYIAPAARARSRSRGSASDGRLAQSSAYGRGRFLHVDEDALMPAGAAIAAVSPVSADNSPTSAWTNSNRRSAAVRHAARTESQRGLG